MGWSSRHSGEGKTDSRTEPADGSRDLKAAAVPRVPPHELRHTAASRAVSAAANVKAVQRVLGHTSAAMTFDVYADLFEDDVEAFWGGIGPRCNFTAAPCGPVHEGTI